MNFVGWLILFVICKVCYNGALMIYDSMLIDTTSMDRTDKISSYGYAFGYIGSLVPFLIGIVICAFGFTSYEAVNPLTGEVLTGMDASLACPWGYLICFIINALWWLAFTIPLFKTYKYKDAFKDVFYIKKDIDVNKLKLQLDEVEYVKYLSKDEIMELINNNGNIRKTNIDAFLDLIKDNN